MAEHIQIDLRHHHALVTGGGSGIGLAIAERFLEAGARVSIMGRSQERLDEALQGLAGPGKTGEAAAFSGDITLEADIACVLEQARDRFGSVTCLVNNAGAVESLAFRDTGPDHWQRIITVNLTGAYLVTKAFIDDLLAAKDGRIINIASTAGLKGYPYVAAYNAAKHGLVGLTRSLAVEFAGTELTVNAICPGFTDTDMARDAIKKVMELTGRDEATIKKGLLEGNPQGRLIEPGEVAAAALWLAGREARSVTGQTIAISGGETW